GRVFRWYDPRGPHQAGCRIGELDSDDRLRLAGTGLWGSGLAAPLFASTMVLTPADGPAHTHRHRPLPRAHRAQTLESPGHTHSAAGRQCARYRYGCAVRRIAEVPPLSPAPCAFHRGVTRDGDIRRPA